MDTWIKERLPYVYGLPLIYKDDFIDLRNQVVTRFLETDQLPKYEYLINGWFPFIRYGKYKLKYQYVLPGGDYGSGAVVEYRNPIK